jgi:hypothetical protein
MASILKTSLVATAARSLMIVFGKRKPSIIEHILDLSQAQILSLNSISSCHHGEVPLVYSN